jgi:iron complex transport system substrate-binding protein
MVFALGAQERVVGVSAFSEFPPAIQAKPVFGSALEPNRERLLRLKPDLILAQGKSAALAEFAQAHGMAFLSYPLDSVADIRAAIRGIADVLGAEAEAARLLRELEEALAAPAPETAVPVFIALGHSPGDFSALMTAGPGTFLDEWVTLAGGSNIFSDVAAPWPPISLEVLIRRNPVVILDLQHAPPSVAEQQALRADWERMGFGKERIRLLSEAALLRPGVRMAKALQALRAALHSSE